MAAQAAGKGSLSLHHDIALMIWFLHDDLVLPLAISVDRMAQFVALSLLKQVVSGSSTIQNLSPNLILFSISAKYSDFFFFKVDNIPVQHPSLRKASTQLLPST